MTEVTTKKNYNISIYLDTRRATKDGKYPVKLRVFTSQPKKQKLMSTKFKFTQAEYDSIWTIKPRKEYKAIKQEIDAVLFHAEHVAKSLTPFTFDKFEKKINVKAGDSTRVEYMYQSQIEELTRQWTTEYCKYLRLSSKVLCSFLSTQEEKNTIRLPYLILIKNG